MGLFSTFYLSKCVLATLTIPCQTSSNTKVVSIIEQHFVVFSLQYLDIDVGDDFLLGDFKCSCECVVVVFLSMFPCRLKHVITISFPNIYMHYDCRQFQLRLTRMKSFCMKRLFLQGMMLLRQCVS